MNLEKSLNVARFRRQLTRLTRRLRREAQNDPESWTRMLVISAIDRLGDGVTPSMLAASENMRSSNLAAVLRELEASGLIIRTQDALDRRKVRVQLTDAGRHVLQLSRQRRDDWLMAAMMACLTGEEREQLIDAGELLERLAAYSDSASVDKENRL